MKKNTTTQRSLQMCEMKSKRQYVKNMSLLFLLITLFLCSAHAQNFNVTGMVADSQKAALPYCNAILKTANNKTFVTGSTTDQKGVFSLSVPAGTYMLHVSFIGYEEYTKQIVVKETVSLERITLQASSVKLKELTVLGSRVERKSSSDTYYLKGDQQTIGRNALEVISQAAGVTVDGNNGIMIYGKEGVRVSIDGHLLNYSGTELAGYLSGINGSDLASMEIDRAPSASYNADIKGGVIRLKTKKRQADGYEAFLEHQFDYYKLHLLGIVPQFDINARTGKLTWHNNFNYNSVGARDYLTQDSRYKGDNAGVSTTTTTDYKVTADAYEDLLEGVYDISNKQSLGFRIHGRYEKAIEATNTPSTITNKASTEKYHIDYKDSRKQYDFDASLNYLWQINKASELKVGGDYIFSNNRTTFDNILTNLQDISYLDETFSRLHRTLHNYTGGVDYKYEVSPALSFSMGAKFSRSVLSIAEDYMYKDSPNGNFVNDADNIDNISYKERIWAAYANSDYSTGLWTFNAGLRFEQTLRDVNSNNFPSKDAHRTYNNFFPMFTASYILSKTKGHQLSFILKSGIARPSFFDLQPLVARQSPYIYIKGNPDLTPSYNYSAGIDLILFKAFYFGTSFTRDKDQIERIFAPRKSGDLVIYGQKLNMKKVDTYSMQTFIPAPVTKNILMGLTLREAYLKRELYSGLKDNTWSFYAKVSANVKITPTFSFDTNFSYLNKMFVGNTNLRKYYTLNFSIRKTFLQNKLQVALVGANILGRKLLIDFDDPGVFMRYDRIESRSCQNYKFTIRYLFNSKNKVKARKVEGFNEEELSR